MYIDVSREAAAWLGLVNHDLVKRLLWPARDRRALGGPVQPGELVVVLADGDGNPHSAEQTWQTLRAEAPALGPAIAPVLAAFDAAVSAAQRAAAADDLDGVLALEAAFDTLARKVKEATAAPPLPGSSNPSR
jgi:hypothetical protein